MNIKRYLDMDHNISGTRLEHLIKTMWAQMTYDPLKFQARVFWFTMLVVGIVSGIIVSFFPEPTMKEIYIYSAIVLTPLIIALLIIVWNFSDEDDIGSDKEYFMPFVIVSGAMFLGSFVGAVLTSCHPVS